MLSARPVEPPGTEHPTHRMNTVASQSATAVDLTEEFQDLLAGKIQLRRQVKELQAHYRNGRPYPHLVIDDLFLSRDLDALLGEMAQMGRDQWASMEQDPRERTVRMRSATEIGAAGERMLSIVHSAAFLYLVGELTGIGQLLPDPYLKGAGYARMRRGDYFSVHSDRNIAYETGLTRRLAMIVFLNKTWRPDWRGELELWSHDGRRCEAQIEPLYNRTVLFEVADPNFHGVPHPIMCPPDHARQSFILYYHTVGADPRVLPHSSLFAPRFYGSNRLRWRSLVREITPPIMTRAIRRLSRRDY